MLYIIIHTKINFSSKCNHFSNNINFGQTQNPGKCTSPSDLQIGWKQIIKLLRKNIFEKFWKANSR